MAKATAATRAPRGTKVLVQAFFSAAEEIPDSQRASVVKAALAAIRGTLKDAREKAKNAKAKAKAGKASTARTSKAVGRPKGTGTAVKKAASTSGGRKVPAKRGRQPVRKEAPEAAGEANAE
jgi:hypothetical protein